MLLLHRACSAVDKQREQEITNHWEKNQQVPRMSNLHTQVQRRHIHRKGLRGPQNLTGLIGKGISLYSVGP